MGMFSQEFSSFLPCECFYCWANLFLKITHKGLCNYRIFCWDDQYGEKITNTSKHYTEYVVTNLSEQIKIVGNIYIYIYIYSFPLNVPHKLRTQYVILLSKHLRTLLCITSIKTTNTILKFIPIIIWMRYIKTVFLCR